MQVAKKVAEGMRDKSSEVRTPADEGARSMALSSINAWWISHVRLSSWWTRVVLFQRLYHPGSFRSDDKATNDRAGCALHAKRARSPEVD